MSHENMADQSAFLQAACTKSKCIELLALAADYREALPQVLELLRQYYAAEKVCFYECGEPDTDGRQEAGSFSVQALTGTQILCHFLFLLFLRRICTENCR